MLLSIFGVLAVLLLIMFVSRELENRKATKRHVELVKQAFEEELKRVKAESISIPGGKF
jgi:regulatory protein YycI of two-component signal transduction system YycFG